MYLYRNPFSFFLRCLRLFSFLFLSFSTFQSLSCCPYFLCLGRQRPHTATSSFRNSLHFTPFIHSQTDTQPHKQSPFFFLFFFFTFFFFLAFFFLFFFPMQLQTLNKMYIMGRSLGPRKSFAYEGHFRWLPIVWCSFRG
ncbi:hypothetical protein F5H01DRAFT_201061 [Linnemannia elongata]|nr:hypothetical protein F5H01DRAFT_201061 [Linnemannia elongata]